MDFYLAINRKICVCTFKDKIKSLLPPKEMIDASWFVNSEVDIMFGYLWKKRIPKVIEQKHKFNFFKALTRFFRKKAHVVLNQY